MRRLRTLAAVTALVALPAAAFGQLGTGRVAGTIRDERGRPLKGATVVAANDVYFPRSFSAATDDKGRFSILGLRRAIYKVTIRAAGFETVTFDLPVVSGPRNPALDLKLVRSLEPAPPPLLANADAARLQTELDEAASLVAAGRIEAAIAAYGRIARSTPALTSVNLQLGYLYEVTGDRRSAIAAYEAALRTDPTSIRSREALARLNRP
ncbi:MAG: carboxypeptidase regulatory-like domain-containing protein [Acidobacteria bacterium]|nr:carboxypeptidase regulatory-like domain-containing protein [Acidobacteriota bacterium]